MRNKKHGIIALIFAGLLFVDQAYSVGFIALSIGLYLLYKWWNHPQRILLDSIKNDSQSFGVVIPTSYPLQQELLSLYSKLKRLQTQYPALQGSYQEFANSIWLQLSQESDVNNWKRIVQNAYNSMPSPLDVKDLMNKQLEKLKKETELWNQAKIKSVAR